MYSSFLHSWILKAFILFFYRTGTITEAGAARAGFISILCLELYLLSELLNLVDCRIYCARQKEKIVENEIEREWWRNRCCRYIHCFLPCTHYASMHTACTSEVWQVYNMACYWQGCVHYGCAVSYVKLRYYGGFCPKSISQKITVLVWKISKNNLISRHYIQPVY